MELKTEIMERSLTGVSGELFSAFLDGFRKQNTLPQDHELLAGIATAAVKESLGGRVLYIPLAAGSKKEARNKQILAAWRGGCKSIRDLALKFNISQQRVYEVLADNQEQPVGKAGRKRGSFDARNKAIYQAWVSGEKNEAQLALEHRLSSDYVKQIVKSTQLKLWQDKHK